MYFADCFHADVTTLIRNHSKMAYLLSVAKRSTAVALVAFDPTISIARSCRRAEMDPIAPH